MKLIIAILRGTNYFHIECLFVFMVLSSITKYISIRLND